MYVKSGRAEQARETRGALVREARRLFAEAGYADASTSEIVERAGVTKGALYHHFADKLALYEAVVEDVERDLGSRIRAAAVEADPWRRLEAMCGAYLDASLDAEVARILVLEAPVVLGWRRWCELAHEHEMGAFAECLGDAMEAGLIAAEPPEMLAQVLLGALNTAARVVATAVDAGAARSQVEETVRRLLVGLRTQDLGSSQSATQGRA